MIKYSFVKKIPGHTNSSGDLAEWCIVSENDKNKIISSHKSKEDAKKHLQDIEIHKKSFIGSLFLIDEVNLNSNLFLYKFADKIPGGQGDDFLLKHIPKQELLTGMEIESEHSSDPEIQKEIVKDHEQETINMTGKPNYYKFLTKMEHEMKGK